MKTILILLTLSILFIGCSDQDRAKSFGGTATIDLPAGKELVNLSWKETNLWYCIRDRKAGETIDTFQYQESSSYGIVEGTIIVIEH